MWHETLVFQTQIQQCTIILQWNVTAEQNSKTTATEAAPWSGPFKTDNYQLVQWGLRLYCRLHYWCQYDYLDLGASYLMTQKQRHFRKRITAWQKACYLTNSSYWDIMSTLSFKYSIYLFWNPAGSSVKLRPIRNGSKFSEQKV